MPPETTKPSRQDEAAAWFAAERAGVMLIEQRAAFDAWRADPRNQAALDAMHELWNDLGVLKGREPTPKARVQTNRLKQVAAGLVIFLIAGVAVFGLLAPRQGISITTAEGEQTTQSMADGSLIAVNVASSVSYAVTETTRMVDLVDGEAAFSVKPDAARPFVVRAGDYEIRAVGTAFNVRRRDGVVQIAVSEGRVEVCRISAEGKVVVLGTLSVGELLELPAEPAETPMPPPAAVPPAQVSEWRMRIVTYQDATVREVAEDFNRYFEQKVVVDQPALLSKRVTIRLQVEDRARALATLAALLDAEVVVRGGTETLIE